MNQIQKMTRNVPKFLIFFFIALLSFNIITYLFTPGLKESMKYNNSIIEAHSKNGERKLNRRLRQIEDSGKSMKRNIKVQNERDDRRFWQLVRRFQKNEEKLGNVSPVSADRVEENDKLLISSS